MKAGLYRNKAGEELQVLLWPLLLVREFRTLSDDIYEAEVPNRSWPRRESYIVTEQSMSDAGYELVVEDER